jgi:hydroxysqualene synthase
MVDKPRILATAPRRTGLRETGRLSHRKPSGPIDNRAVSVEHYENFPVASWLCPPRLRAPIRAIYHFARTADDIADEGDANVETRFELLARYRAQTHRLWEGRGTDASEWHAIFQGLDVAREAWRLPLQPFDDLLDAFAADAAGTRFHDRQALLDYAQKSAAPIGRLLLHLYGIDDAHALAESDDICIALQLINFWQDIQVDLTRGRCNLPLAELNALGLASPIEANESHLLIINRLLPQWADWSRDLMRRGAGLVHRVPGRIGWELRLVVQGGLLILDKLAEGGYDSRNRRVVLRQWDVARMVFRACRMLPVSPRAT